MKIRALLTALSLLTAACGTASTATPREVRLGYFPNITHATALLGVERGLYARHLGLPIRASTFNAGPAAVEALFSGAVDAAYLGPNPAINAWARSKGSAVRIVAGAASGGVYLITRPGIDDVRQLSGKKIATPQLGNTQDVALRYWLRQNGLRTDTKGGGDVHIVPQENAQTLQTFATGDIDGAWVPEPFASRLRLESKGRVLLDERELWPGKEFVITHLVVRQEWARQHPDLLSRLLEAHVEANEALTKEPEAAARTVNAAIEKLTQKPLRPDVLDSAFKNITFTDDPVAASLTGSAEHAVQVGLLKPVNLKGIYDLGPLNKILTARGRPPVTDS